MKIIFIVSFLVLGSFLHTIHADGPGYQIEIKAPGWKDKSVFLCYYFNGNVYKQDSMQVAKSGKAVFSGKEPLPQGLYGIFSDYDKRKLFDFLLAGDQHFRIEVDTAGFPANNKITGAVQSEAFRSYTRFLSERQSDRLPLLEQLKTAPDEQQEALKEQLDSLNNRVEQFINGFLQQHRGQWVGDFFQGLQPLDSPFPSPQTQEEYNQETDFLRRHYFDHIDLTDPRFWRTNYFPKKIDTYMERIVVRHPDSLAVAASRLVAAAEPDSLCFRLMLSRLFNYGAKSQFMGMENIWAKLAEDYYFSGKASWADSTYLATLKAEYKKIEHNRLGMTIPNMTFTGIDGKPVELYQIQSEYTLLYFFEPGCGHCKKMTPAIHDNIYRQFKEKGLEVVCVYTYVEEESWKAFIEQHHLHDWINVWDPQRITLFWEFFDVSVTPGVYLLDKNKKVIAKKMDEKTLSDLLEKLTGSTSTDAAAGSPSSH